MKKIILTLLTLGLFASCQKNVGADGSNAAVKFGAAEIDTRVANNEWEKNDKIGIFAIDGDNGKVLCENYKYATYGDKPVEFFNEDKLVAYDRAVVTHSFLSYYPYSSRATEQYSVDVSDQRSLNDIDLMVSDVVTQTKEQQGEVVKFSYSHKLSLVEFVIGVDDIKSDIADIQSVTISGLDSRCDYQFESGSFGESSEPTDIEMNIVIEGDKIVARAILIPSSDEFDIKISFRGESFVASINDDLIGGKKHDFSTKLGYGNVNFTLKAVNITSWVDSASATVGNGDFKFDLDW